MIFANGDCAITYQQNEVISEDAQEKVKQAFFQSKDYAYLTNIMSTENTFTFSYEPITLMETHNTIEPCGIVINEVTEFLKGEGF